MHIKTYAETKEWFEVFFATKLNLNLVFKKLYTVP
jgi:hypothetical protein